MTDYKDNPNDFTARIRQYAPEVRRRLSILIREMPEIAKLDDADLSDIANNSLKADDLIQAMAQIQASEDSYDFEWVKLLFD